MNEKELEKKLAQYKKINPPARLIYKIRDDFENMDKGRLSLKQIIFHQTHNFMNWKIFVPVVVVVLVIVVWATFKIGPKEVVTIITTGQFPGEEKYVETPKTVFVPDATGNIDDLVNAMTAFSENEMAAIVDEGNDISLADWDSEAISDFGQSYDEDELKRF